jgi:cytidine deaminase
MGEIDWTRLRAAARAAMEHAYTPYSRFPVGAAGLVTDGRLITGCNVENASYGLTLCAECSLVSALYACAGGHEHPTANPDRVQLDPPKPRPMLVAVSIVAGDGEPVAPCGRCRQLLWEHGGPGLLVETVSGIRPMTDILPDAFGPDDLKS